MVRKFQKAGLILYILNGEKENNTRAFDNDNTRVVNPRILRFENKVSLPTPFERAQALHEANLTYIEPATPEYTGYQYDKDRAKLKYETQLWVLLKKALEDATNEMMFSLIDPRYYVAGFGAGQLIRGVGVAANAGRNLYKTYKLSKAINKAVKNTNPGVSSRTISVRYNNAVQGGNHSGVGRVIEVPETKTYTLYDLFGEPIGSTTVGEGSRVGNSKVDMIRGKGGGVTEDTYNFEVLNNRSALGNGLESGWDLASPLKTLHVTSRFPHEIIGESDGNPVRLLTGTTSRPLPQQVSGSHRITVTEPQTNLNTDGASLKFFERQPSRITETERLGLPKEVRNNINSSDPSGENLHRFYSLLDRLLTLRNAIRKLRSPANDVSSTIVKNNPKVTIDPDMNTLTGSTYRTYPRAGEKAFTTDVNVSFRRNGISSSGHNYGVNLGGLGTSVKDLMSSDKIVFGNPSLNDVVITADDVVGVKKGVKDLVQGMKDMEHGAEFSGDARFTTPAEALAGWLKLAKKPSLKEMAMKNAKLTLDKNLGIDLGTPGPIYDPVRGISTENPTMSPDAYSFFMRTAGDNPGIFHIGYGGEGTAGYFNSYARHPLNAPMYEIELNYLDGLITPRKYVNEFNKWGKGLGLRRAYFYNGRLYKPQPFLIRNKQGGRINKIRKKQ